MGSAAGKGRVPPDGGQANDRRLGPRGPSITAAFLASAVEFVEALTVVLAVGTVRGWRGALIGSGGAVVVLLAIVAVLGPVLTRIPPRNRAACGRNAAAAVRHALATQGDPAISRRHPAA